MLHYWNIPMNLPAYLSYKVLALNPILVSSALTLLAASLWLPSTSILQMLIIPLVTVPSMANILGYPTQKDTPGILYKDLWDAVVLNPSHNS
jgi:hypothetical protein